MKNIKKTALAAAVLMSLMTGSSVWAAEETKSANEINADTSVSTGNTLTLTAGATGSRITVEGGILNIGKGVEFTQSDRSEDGNSQGGAIFLDKAVGSRVAIDGATFSKNKANWFGAIKIGLASTETSTIANSEFENNEAKAAGALGLFKLVDVTDTTFTGNKATAADDDGAGAVFLGAESVVKISDSTFTRNESANRGGAISTRKAPLGNNKDAKLDIIDTIFTDNKAATNGGAIDNHLMHSVNKTDAVYVSGSTFTGNSADKGGAIFNNDKDNAANIVAMYITNSTFDKNKAITSGGAIRNEGKLTIVDSNFTGNEVTSSGEYYGGAIQSAKAATLDISGGKFYGNKASLGGAIVTGTTAGNTITVDGTTFEANEAGAYGAVGIFKNGTIKNATFKNNVADTTKHTVTAQDENSGAGALFLGSQAIVKVENSSFTGNTSNKCGGAIATRSDPYGNNDVYKPQLDILNSTFTNNRAITYGGAIDNSFLHSAQLKDSANDAVYVSGSIFDGNSAANGGAIHNNDHDNASHVCAMYITDSIFTDNTATEAGGAIHNEGKLTLDNVTFSGNTANGKPNDIYNAGSLTFKGKNTLNGGVENAATGRLKFEADSVTTLGGVNNIKPNYSTETTTQTAVYVDASGTQVKASGDFTVEVQGNTGCAVRGITVRGGTGADKTTFYEKGDSFVYNDPNGKLDVKVTSTSTDTGKTSNGITALYGGAIVDINAKIVNVDVTADKNFAFALSSSVNVLDSGKETKLIVNAEEITLKAKSKQNDASVAINAMSEGYVELNGNLTAEAANVITARGGATVLVNKNGTGTVKLTGDVDYDYDKNTSGTPVAADVQINLTDEKSVWTGVVKVTGNEIPKDYDKTKAMRLNLSNGATWTLTGNSLMNYLTVDGGKVLADNDVIITTNDGSVLLKNATVSEKVGFTLNNSTLTADSSLFLTKEYAATTQGSNLVGTSGSVNLYLTRDTDNLVEYTAAQYNAAKSALFTAGENATLAFLNGKLAVGAEQTVVVNGTQSTDEKKPVTITNTNPTVVSKDDVADEGTQVAAVQTEYVNVTGAGNEQDKSLDESLATTSEITVTNSNFVAKGLRVKEAAKDGAVNLTLGAGTNITFAGDADGTSMIVDENGDGVKATLQVGQADGTENEATFNVGLIGGGVENQKLQIDVIKMKNGTMNVQDAELTVNKLQAGDGAGEKQVNVFGGSLAVTENNGVDVFLDPAFADSIDKGSAYSQDGTSVNSKLIAGRNSLIVLGETDRTKAEQVFNSMEAGLKFGNAGDVNAVLYVAKAQTMGTNGGVYLDGSLTAPLDVTAGSFTAKAKSLTMIPGNICKDGTDTAAIGGLTGAQVDDGAKLYIEGAEVGTYKVLGAAASAGATAGITIDGWQATDILANSLVEVDTDALASQTGDSFSVTFKQADVDLSDSVISNVGEEMAKAEAGSSAREAMKEMLSDLYTEDQKAANVNAYANLGENLGVTRGAYDVANMVGNAVTEHWDNNAKGENIWAVYTRNKTDVDGMELGGMEAQYDAHYNGVVVGADLSKGFGIALNYADGNVSNYLGGHNDAKYYGASLYGRKVWGNFSLNMDAGYTYGKNELAQNGIEADAKTDTISAGLTAKYLAKAGKYDKIGLFAGARYMHIDGRDYTDSLGVNREADKINSVVVPVGLEYTGEFKMAKSAWTFKPVLAVGYLFNLGDRENDMTMRYGGAEDIFGYDFVDKGAFFTHAGMDFEKKNFTLGISYDFMKSKNSKNNRWNVNANLAF